MRKLRWRSELECFLDPEQGVLLLDSRGGRLIFDPNLQHLAPLLEEGGWSEEELALRLAGRFPVVTTLLTLQRLRERGLLEEGESAEPPDPPHRLALKLRWCPLRLHLVCLLPDALELRLPDDRGVEWRLEGQEADVSLVLLKDPLHRDTAAFLERLPESRPWYPVRVSGPQLWLGPLLLNRDDPRWEALRERTRLMRPAHHAASLAGGKVEPWGEPAMYSGLSLELGLLTAVLELRSGRAGELVEVDLTTGGSSRHRLPARYRGSHANFEPPRFNGSPKPHPRAGRTESTASAWDRLAYHVSPVCGVVARLRALEDNPFELPMVVADQPFPLRSRRFALLPDAVRGWALGTGSSWAEARLAAVCEALERYSGSFREGDALRQARRSDLGEEALDPAELLGFSQGQYRRREEINRTAEPCLLVPEPYRPDRVHAWSPVWSLTRECPRWLPTVYLYYTTPALESDAALPCCGPDSNGCAAGANLEEAAFYGLLELIERDAVAIWWYNRLCRPRLRLDELGSSVQRLERRFRQAGREVWALDVTTELGVTAVVAISCRADHRDQVTFGFGCHPDPARACERALREAAGITCYLTGLLEEVPATVTAWMEAHDLDRQAHLRPAEGAWVGRAELPQWSGEPTMLAELERLRARLEERGLEVLLHRQTRPDVELEVVKMVVPGLCHHWTRFAPGRLYDVPVRMGWQEAPLAEGGLNPVPLIL
ncbi:MAG: YcaO-like family protein [Armatimonadetes bacterium]|nr:YcaO-like family protein [Armatimonadota bacterium]